MDCTPVHFSPVIDVGEALDIANSAWGGIKADNALVARGMDQTGTRIDYSTVSHGARPSASRSGRTPER